MLPKTIVIMSTLAGNTELSSRPSAKNDVKTTPITASSRTRVFVFTNAIAPAASNPATKAPSANGSPAEIGNRHSGHHRVRKRIAHQRPAAAG